MQDSSILNIVTLGYFYIPVFFFNYATNFRLAFWYVQKTLQHLSQTSYVSHNIYIFLTYTQKFKSKALFAFW